MKEYPIELIGCIVVIWKRKIMIIVGVLVCMVAGGVVSLRLSETYRAENLIKVGKILQPFSVNTSSINTSSFILVDSIRDMIEAIPIEYGITNENEVLGDSLKVEEVKGTSMLKVIQEAYDRKRAREMLKSVVNRLLADHHSIAEDSIQPYKVHIGLQEKYIKQIQRNQKEWKAELVERNMKKDFKEVDHITLKMVLDQNLEMIRLLNGNLQNSNADIAKIKQEISNCVYLVDSFNKYKTRVIGGMKETTIKPKRKRNVVLAGVVGLIVSLFLAFSLEYLGNVSEWEKKEKSKGNSVSG